MKIKGIVEFNNNGILSNETIDIDMTSPTSDMSETIADAISFALFGKTIFNSILPTEKGVPLIVLELDADEKILKVVRRPEYLRETALGSRYLEKELFSLKTEKEEYPALASEKYYAILKDFAPLSYDDFAAYCRTRK